MTHIVSVGDLMVDVVALLPGPLARGSDTPAAVRFLGGGAAANVAAWSVAAGGAATFVGSVGDDALGRDAIASLRATGVDVRAVVDATRPTGTCIVLVDPTGERTMIPSAGANEAGPDLAALPEDADWLALSGYALLRPASRPSARAALALARARGWSVAVDAGSAAPLLAAGPAAFLDWIAPGPVLLLANAAEARVLTGLIDPAGAAHDLARRVGSAAVKLGAGGAVWSDGAAVCSMPAVAATAVDTTGAGDAFTAGFLTTDGPGAQRLAGALRLAATAVGQAGARPPSAAG